MMRFCRRRAMKIKFTFKTLFRSKDIESKLSFFFKIQQVDFWFSVPNSALGERLRSIFRLLFLFGFSPLSLGCDSPSIVASQEVLQLTVNTNERIERFQ